MLDSEVEDSMIEEDFGPGSLLSPIFGEDIDSLMNIGTEGVVTDVRGRRYGTGQGQGHDDPLIETDQGNGDVDDMFSLGEKGPTPVAVGGMAGANGGMLRRLSYGVVKAIGKSKEGLSDGGAFVGSTMMIDIGGGGEPIAIPLEGPTVESPPAERHKTVFRGPPPLLSVTEGTTTDIDAVLGIDPDPNALAAQMFPHVTDVDDVLNFGGRLSDAPRPIPHMMASGSRRRSSAGRSLSVPMLRAARSLGSIGILSGGSNMRSTMSLSIITRPVAVPRTAYRVAKSADAINADIEKAYPFSQKEGVGMDIFQLISFGGNAKAGPGPVRDVPTMDTAASGEPQDIETLMRVGEHAKEAMLDGGTATAGSHHFLAPPPPASASVTRSQNALNRSIAIAASQQLHAAHTLRNRVSFIESNEPGVAAKHSTFINALPPIPANVGCMDIDGYLSARRRAGASASKPWRSTSRLDGEPAVFKKPTDEDDLGQRKRVRSGDILADPAPLAEVTAVSVVPEGSALDPPVPVHRSTTQKLRGQRPRSISEPHRTAVVGHGLHPLSGLSSPLQAASPRGTRALKAKNPSNHRLASMDISSFIDIAEGAASPPPPKVRIDEVGRVSSIDIRAFLDLAGGTAENSDAVAMDTTQEEGSTVEVSTIAPEPPSRRVVFTETRPRSKSRVMASVENLIQRRGSADPQRKRKTASSDEIGTRGGGGVDGYVGAGKRVEVDPPKLDIDDLLQWGAEMSAVIDRKFSVATNTGTTGSAGLGSAAGSSSQGLVQETGSAGEAI
ncbi:hypothetical protein HK104_001627 [Borealophlyctis nickersoniae]|nr:hypothetical protein HK104_001627 [Borealophlyctis nickersoniae]